MSSGREEFNAELERLRKLERGLRDERERIRGEAEEEVARLQAALRETAARAAERERELQLLKGQRERRGDDRAPGRGLRRDHGEAESAAALERVRVVFERERLELEERARAVAQTEMRQRGTEAELRARVERIARARPEPSGASPELLVARRRIEELECRLAEHEQAARQRREAAAPLPSPPTSSSDAAPERDRLHRDLVRREEAVTQREVELSVVRRRIGEEERRLQERSWRAGAHPAPGARSSVSFSDGWRLLAGTHRGGEEETGGSW